MSLVFTGTVIFGTGALLLAAFRWIAGQLARPLHLPMDVVNGVLDGIGFLIAMPFVFGILLQSHVSILSSLFACGALLLCAAFSFGYSLFRLLVPVLKAESARG